MHYLTAQPPKLRSTHQPISLPTTPLLVATSFVLALATCLMIASAQQDSRRKQQCNQLAQVTGYITEYNTSSGQCFVALDLSAATGRSEIRLQELAMGVK